MIAILMLGKLLEEKREEWTKILKISFRLFFEIKQSVKKWNSLNVNFMI